MNSNPFFQNWWEELDHRQLGKLACPIELKGSRTSQQHGVSGGSLDQE
jgi:hypothetical protein